MQQAAEGEPVTDAMVGHWDACLSCMACVTACPSGVAYDQLIEAVRPQVERNWARTRADRLFRALIFGLFPYPRRLRVAAVFGLAYQRLGLRALVRATGMGRILPARLRALESLMPSVRLGSALRDLPERTAPTSPADRLPGGAPRRRVGMLTGCVQRVFFAQVNEATARVLAAEGCEVIAPTDQACCGALSEHAGREPEALDRARRLIEVFERANVDTVVANVAGCGSNLKDYGRLLADDPVFAERAASFAAKVRDVTEVLAELEPIAPRHPIAATVAYHDACHLAHAQGVRSQPREVLRTIPGIELADLPEAEICCGSAGIYNLVAPQAAEELGQRKAANIASVGPDAVATANAGCLLQIGRHTQGGIPLFHPVELLDASIRGVNPLRG
jgi:glycolate oxidase iron-sulfur subunit